MVKEIVKNKHTVVFHLNAPIFNQIDEALTAKMAGEHFWLVLNNIGLGTEHLYCWNLPKMEHDIIAKRVLSNRNVYDIPRVYLTLKRTRAILTRVDP